MVTGSPVLLSLFQWENRNVDLITLGLLIFSIQIQISSDLLCSIILILPHPTLPHLSKKEFSPEEPVSKTGSNRSGIGTASTCVCEKTKFIREIALCSSRGGITILPPVSSVSWPLTAGMSWLVTSSVWSVSF